MNEKETEKLILALQGKCKIDLPHFQCHQGKFPMCTDGKLPKITQLRIICDKRQGTSRN